MFWKRSRWLILAALIPVIIAPGALGRAPAFAAHQSTAHGHFLGGNGKTAQLYTPAHPVKVGKIAYDTVNGARVSATRFAVGSSAATCAEPQVCPNGGPVQAHPQVYLVFWGKWWHCTGAGCTNCPTSSTGCGDANSLRVENYLYDYWHQVGLPGESHATITSQYYDKSGAHPTFGHGVWGTQCSTDGNCGWVAWQQDPPSTPSTADIGTMASTAANYFGLQSNSNAQIIVLTPQGNRPGGFPDAGFCAWHSSVPSSTSAQLSFTLMPWLPDSSVLLVLPNCDTSFGLFTNMDGWSEVGGHEFAESATDPVPGTGYYTALPGDSQNTEIGDRCNSNTWKEPMSNGSTYSQQELWSNLDHSCVQTMPVGAVTGYKGKCIDNAGGRRAVGNKIEIWRCNGTGAQLLYYTTSSGHLIVNGGCLDVSGGSHNPGTKVIWYTCGTGSNDDWTYDSSSQQWKVYSGVLGYGAMCLDDPGFSTNNGTGLIIYNCNSGANQKWTLPRG